MAEIIEKPDLYTAASDLPEPLAGWLNPEQSLPQGVRFFPIRIRPSTEFMPGLLVGLFFLIMGLAAPAAFIAQTMRSGFSSLSLYLLFGTLFLFLFLALFIYALSISALREWRLARDQRFGRLRHGLFIGDHKILFRLPGELHLIPRSSFSSAAVEIQLEKQQLQPFILFPFIENGPDPEQNRDPLAVKGDLIAGDLELIVQTINQSV